MEPVTHFLTGACLGRSGFNRKTAYATLAMTLAAEAPDIDMIWEVRGPLAEFEHHRGLTHTFLGAPFMALAVVGVVWLIHRARRRPPATEPRWLVLWWCALLADLSHILLDFTNNYGVRPFYPFSPHWYAWSIVWILEPLILAGLLMAFVMPWLLGLADREMGANRGLFRGRGWAIAALVWMVVVWAVRNAEHAHALVLLQQDGLTREPAIRVGAEPYPVNPFLWRGLAETADYYQTATVHTRGEQVETDEADDLLYKPPVTPSVAAAKQSWLGRVYLDWGSWPVVTDLGAVMIPKADGMPPGSHWTTVRFNDLRFGYSPVSASPRPVEWTALDGWAYVTGGREVDTIYFGGRKQRQ